MKSIKIVFAVLLAVAISMLTSLSPSAKAGVEFSPVLSVAKQEPASQIASLDDVKKAVVRIETRGSFWPRPFGPPSQRGTGTGFIINSQGFAVTNNHVVAGASSLQVWLEGEVTPRFARIVAVAECSDLAVIDIVGEGFAHLDWSRQSIAAGLSVHAAGFPFGTPTHTLSSGTISNTQAEGDSLWSSINNVIEHSAAISPGNSGGPLVDDFGKVVAVNYLRSPRTGLSYAISQVEAASIVSTLSSGQDVHSIGISGISVPLTDDAAAIWISAVTPGTPAGLLGLQSGDVIWNIDGTFLQSDSLMADYCETLKRNPSGQTLQLEIYRSQSGQFLSGQLNGSTLRVVTPPSGTELPIPNNDATTSPSETPSSPSQDAKSAAESYSIVPPPSWFIRSENSQITLDGLEVDIELNSSAGSYLLVTAVGSEDARFLPIDALHKDVRKNLITEGTINRCASLSDGDLTYGDYDMTYSRWTSCPPSTGAAGLNEVYVMTAKSRTAPYHMVGLLGGFAATDNGYDVLLRTLSGLQVENPPPRRSIIPQQPAPQQTTPRQAILATIRVSALNVRSGPGLAYSVISQVYQGNQVMVVGQVDGCGWLRVVTQTGVQGWVSGNSAYVQLAGTCAAIQ